MTPSAGTTAPIIAAVAKSGSVTYAEIVSSIPARSAGPDIRAGVDDLIETTCTAIQNVGARHAKVISLLSPSPATRYTVYCLVDGAADHAGRGVHVGALAEGGETVAVGAQDGRIRAHAAILGPPCREPGLHSGT